MAQDLALSRFRTLVDDIARLYVTARKAQVAFAWETGKRIVEEEQNGEMRAAYGDYLIPKLSEELSKKYGTGFSATTLKDIRRFYLEHQKSRPADQLTWTNHTLLMRVKDTKVRKALEKRAVREGLGKYQLRQIVAEVNSAAPVLSAPVTPLKRPKDLRLKTYKKSEVRCQKGEGQLLPPTSNLSRLTYLDLGFCVSLPVTQEQLPSVTVTDAPSYTYAASLERVVDGDTLLVVIEAGFGVLVRDKLRLRGINCPELGTPEGEKAKAFVQGVLPKGSVIVLKSSKSGQDKYGRFVVDVFHLGKDSSPSVPRRPGDQQGAGAEGFPSNNAIAEAILQDGTYLNQELLDKAFAVRMM